VRDDEWLKRRQERKARIDNLPLAFVPGRLVFPPEDPPSCKAVAEAYFSIMQHQQEIDPKHLRDARKFIAEFSETESRAGKKRTILQDLEARREQEQLFVEAVRAVAAFESLVMVEAGVLVSDEFEDLLKTRDSRIKVSTLEGNITPNEFKRLEKKAKVEQTVVLTRQQEAQLLVQLEVSPYLLHWISETPLARPQNRPKSIFRDALAIIVFRLVTNHAKNEEQKKTSRCKALTSRIISAISPALAPEFSIKVIEHAIYSK